MIKLTYNDINGPLMGALAHIKDTVPFPIKTAYTLGKIWDQVNSACNKAREEHFVLIKKHALLDEAGNVKSFPAEPATAPNGEPMVDEKGVVVMTPAQPYKIADLPSYQKDMQEFLGTIVELPYTKIPLSEFGKGEITAECAQALDPIITIIAEA